MQSHRMSGHSRKRANRLPSPAQLPFTHPSTHPRTRQCRHDQRQRIPTRSKRRSAIPRRSRTHDTHHETKNPRNQRVPHRPVRCQPSRHVTTQDAEDDPIQRSHHQRSVTRRLTLPREKTHCMQHQIRHKRQRNRSHNPCNHCANTSTKSSRRAHSPPRSQTQSSLRKLQQSIRYSARASLQAQKLSKLRKA
jgi:hypothetical protein